MEERGRRIFVGGLVDGVNWKYREDGLINLNDCRDLIIVDRKYFLQYNALISSWASHVEDSMSGAQKITT